LQVDEEAISIHCVLPGKLAAGGLAMRRFFYSDDCGARISLGLLALRVVVGAAFMFHGWPKIQKPMAWMGPEAPVPAVLQAAAAVAEFVGGAALVVGLFTRFFALLLTITMAVAAGMVHISRGDPFVGKQGEPSWELAAVYFACSLLFLLAGPGRYSLVALLFGRRDDARPSGVP
jgi:putative oxidoreductase